MNKPNRDHSDEAPSQVGTGGHKDDTKTRTVAEEGDTMSNTRENEERTGDRLELAPVEEPTPRFFSTARGKFIRSKKKKEEKRKRRAGRTEKRPELMESLEEEPPFPPGHNEEDSPIIPPTPSSENTPPSSAPGAFQVGDTTRDESSQTDISTVVAYIPDDLPLVHATRIEDSHFERGGENELSPEDPPADLLHENSTRTTSPEDLSEDLEHQEIPTGKTTSPEDPPEDPPESLQHSENSTRTTSSNLPEDPKISTSTITKWGFDFGNRRVRITFLVVLLALVGLSVGVSVAVLGGASSAASSSIGATTGPEATSTALPTHMPSTSPSPPTLPPSSSPTPKPSSSSNPTIMPSASVIPTASPKPTHSPVPTPIPTTTPTCTPSTNPSASPTSSPTPHPTDSPVPTAVPTGHPTSVPIKMPWVQVGNDFVGVGEDDEFGESVSLSKNGRRLAIGAPFHDRDGLNSRGLARVFREREGGDWTQLGDDLLGDSTDDKFGDCVSISGNGERLAVGAPGHDGQRGQVKVFQFESGNWNLLGSPLVGEAKNDRLGFSVSLSFDGSIVAVGAPWNDGINGVWSGHVQIFQYASGSWTQLGDDIDGEAAYDNSGFGVSLSSDGLTVAIGAPFNDGENGSNSGHVRVHIYESGTWKQVGQDIDGEARYDESGWNIALSANGGIVAVGGEFNDGRNGENSGHVRIFEYSQGEEKWLQRGGDIDGEAAHDSSGDYVSLSSDGSIVAVGARSNDGNGDGSGHTRIYKFNGNDWVQVGADIDGEAAGDWSGYSVSLSGDGNRVAIGAKYNDANGNEDSGHARVYKSPFI